MSTITIKILGNIWHTTHLGHGELFSSNHGPLGLKTEMGPPMTKVVRVEEKGTFVIDLTEANVLMARSASLTTGVGYAANLVMDLTIASRPVKVTKEIMTKRRCKTRKGKTMTMGEELINSNCLCSRA